MASIVSSLIVHTEVSDSIVKAKAMETVVEVVQLYMYEEACGGNDCCNRLNVCREESLLNLFGEKSLWDCTYSADYSTSNDAHGTRLHAIQYSRSCFFVYASHEFSPFFHSRHTAYCMHFYHKSSMQNMHIVFGIRSVVAGVRSSSVLDANLTNATVG